MRRYPRGARGPKIDSDALRKLREERGHTQVSLAIEVGTSGAHLSRLETGERCYPSAAITRRLADALGVAMSAILAPDLEEVAP